MYDSHLPRRRVYLRLSVTDRCNLRCRYCRPAGVSGGEKCGLASDDELLGLTELIAQELHVYKVRLTGGEPLLASDPPGLVARLRARLPHLEEIGMTTNGLLLRRYARPLRQVGLQSLNISLDTLDPAACRDLTRDGRLATILDGIAAARDAGFERIKLNTVLLRTVNGDGLCNLVRFATRWDCEIRFIELMPCGEGAGLYAADFLSADEALTRLTEAFEYLGAADDSATARRHRLLVEGRELLVGFITAVSYPFCDACDRLRLDCRGRIFSCLRSSRATHLLAPFRAHDFETVRALVRGSLRAKTPPGAAWPSRHMVTIGG